MVREEKVIIGLCIVILSLFSVQLYIKTTYSTENQTLADLEQNIMVLQKQNNMLENQILALSSLTHINREAKKVGFIPAKTISF